MAALSIGEQLRQFATKRFDDADRAIFEQLHAFHKTANAVSKETFHAHPGVQAARSRLEAENERHLTHSLADVLAGKRKPTPADVASGRIAAGSAAGKEQDVKLALLDSSMVVTVPQRVQDLQPGGSHNPWAMAITQQLQGIVSARDADVLRWLTGIHTQTTSVGFDISLRFEQPNPYLALSQLTACFALNFDDLSSHEPGIEFLASIPDAIPWKAGMNPMVEAPPPPPATASSSIGEKRPRAEKADDTEFPAAKCPSFFYFFCAPPPTGTSAATDEKASDHQRTDDNGELVAISHCDIARFLRSYVCVEPIAYATGLKLPPGVDDDELLDDGDDDTEDDEDDGDDDTEDDEMTSSGDDDDSVKQKPAAPPSECKQQ